MALAAWHYIDFRLLADALLKTSPLVLVVLVVVYTLDRALMAWKWRQLLATAKVIVPYPSVLSAYYRASVVSRLLPTSLGGDVLRAYVVTRQGRNGHVVTMSIVIEKVLAFLASVLLATVGSLLLIPELSGRGALYLLPLAPALGAAVVLAFVFSLHKHPRRLISFLPSERLRHTATQLHEAYGLYKGRWRALVANVGLSLVEQGLQIFNLFLCARSIGLDAPAITLLAALTLSEFLRKAAVVLEGWGFAQVVVVVTLSIVGIDQSHALALSLFSQVATWISVLPGVYLLLRPGGAVGATR